MLCVLLVAPVWGDPTGPASSPTRPPISSSTAAVQVTRPTIGTTNPPGTPSKPAEAPVSRRPGLRWDPSTDRYEASIPGWPIHRVLARLGGQTGWRIWIEDGIEARVQARFANLPAREALDRKSTRLNSSHLVIRMPSSA